MTNSTIIEKILNQNLFGILNKFLFTINNDNFHRELFEIINYVTLKKIINY
ncbi:hypothetical protein [Spiroplasma endosymbiont of Polydrusus formosus]|uniref:hypothetical protein n=1 Tax=Spiroplasma endosymbiont of Polydrusus formosus TaxID=3139326 RepID=UPI0035B557CF